MFIGERKLVKNLYSLFYTSQPRHKPTGALDNVDIRQRFNNT